MSSTNTYFKNYILTYFWQILSLFLSFASYYVVIPFISSDKEIYGIYAVCISLMLFFSYADLGFITSSQKYAAEYFAKKDIKNEIRQIAFGTLVLLIMILCIAVLFCFVYYDPSILISSITDYSESYYIAKKLILTIIIFSPFIALRKAIFIIFDVRLESFISQRVLVVTSLIKVSSVFYFFSETKYDIVSYFLFIQCLDLLATITCFIIAKVKYHYDFYFFVKSMKYTREVFQKVKKLAFSSLLISFSWILYYELDTVVIGKLLGAESVAVYAIAFSIISLFRAMFGILFVPYQSRLNYFKAEEDFQGMKLFALNMIKFSFPLVIIPISIIYFAVDSIILSWVGDSYYESIRVAKWLILCNLFAFISYPSNQLMSTLEKNKMMIQISIVIPFVYWIGVFFTYRFMGIESFAFFKFMSFMVSISFNFYFLKNSLSLSYKNLFQDLFREYWKTILILCILIYFTVPYLTSEFSKQGLIMNILLIGGIFMIVFISLLFNSKSYNLLITEKIKKLIK